MKIIFFMVIDFLKKGNTYNKLPVMVGKEVPNAFISIIFFIYGRQYIWRSHNVHHADCRKM